MTELPLLARQVQAIIEEEENLIANLANFSALLYENLQDINWLGFYIYEPQTNQLVLGPFQGKVACIRIDNGRGVCGAAFKQQQVQMIGDVDRFPGHIACDPTSQSELVIPFRLEKIEIEGVLDIDSPYRHRFTKEDQVLVSACLEQLIEHYRK